MLGTACSLRSTGRLRSWTRRTSQPRFIRTRGTMSSRVQATSIRPQERSRQARWKKPSSCSPVRCSSPGSSCRWCPPQPRHRGGAAGDLPRPVGRALRRADQRVGNHPCGARRRAAPVARQTRRLWPWPISPTSSRARGEACSPTTRSRPTLREPRAACPASPVFRESRVSAGHRLARSVTRRNRCCSTRLMCGKQG